MDLKQIYREIVNEHNLYPSHKKEIENPTITLEGQNPTCGDDIVLQLVVGDDGVIKDAAFTGSGCAVSQASTDIMIDQIIGLDKESALKRVAAFMGMVHGTISEEELEELEEAAALKDVSHMPARAKCATLAWHTLEKMIGGEINE